MQHYPTLPDEEGREDGQLPLRREPANMVFRGSWPIVDNINILIYMSTAML